jgi:hypothetical protein
MAEAKWYVGIDVSKATLDVALGQQGDFWQVKNTSKGIETLVKRLQVQAPTLVVLESTGGYELPAARALDVAGMAVAVSIPGGSVSSPGQSASWQRRIRSMPVCWHSSLKGSNQPRLACQMKRNST